MSAPILPLTVRTDPPVCDLSDGQAFTFIFKIRRSQDIDDVLWPLTLLTIGSVFDVASALAQGSLETRGC